MKIEIEGDSDAAVAVALLQLVMQAEDKEEGADRAWILSTYSQCLAVVTDGVFIGTLDEDAEADDENDEEDAKEEPAKA